MDKNRAKIPGAGLPHNKPDLSLLLDSANKCADSDNGMATDHYLCVMHELIKILQTLHPTLSVFGDNFKSSIKSLEIHRVSGARCYYSNLSLMIQYETEANMVTMVTGTSRLQSGTVAISRLNALLGFILVFIETIHQRSVEERSFPARERVQVYQDTLSCQHSRLTQASCKLALIRCPGKQRLIKHFSSCCHGDASPLNILRKIVESLEPVHRKLEMLLTVID